MVMHVQDTRFTTSRVHEYIAALGLEFLGFDHLRDDIGKRYRERFPENTTATSLANWGRFEEDHPDTFREMYHLWLFKPA